MGVRDREREREKRERKKKKKRLLTGILGDLGAGKDDGVDPVPLLVGREPDEPGLELLHLLPGEMHVAVLALSRLAGHFGPLMLRQGFFFLEVDQASIAHVLRGRVLAFEVFPLRFWSKEEY